MSPLVKPGKRITRKQFARAQLDLFGEVPVTRPDVYAWLLAVVNMDPESGRAEDYVRYYSVLDKIVAAKLNGTFDEITAPVRASARLRELTSASTASPQALSWLGVGEQAQLQKPTSGLLTPKPRRPPRSAKEIAQQREAAKIAKRASASFRSSIFNRWLPDTLPSFESILDDLGKPGAEALGKALKVHSTSVQRWLRAGDAPHTVKLALFWMTRWGIAAVDANAHNDAVNAQRVAGMHAGEAGRLRRELGRVTQIADFGSANDPSTHVHALRTSSEPSMGDPERNGAADAHSMAAAIANTDEGRKCTAA